MSKKRKLNSKNPKYMDKSLVTEKKVIRRELINNVNVNEGFKTDILTDKRYAKRIADQEKANKERDARMKYGKFYNKAKEARDRLRPGEVKRYDKKLGRYVSNKE